MLACASTLVLGLTACKVDNRPLLARDGSEPTYIGSALPAPGPLDLAYAPPMQVGTLERPYDAYGWAERAYGMDRAFYQAEPDYGFSYGDVQPWAWESPDDWTMYAEPIDDGYRFYYYEPEAEHPYFVRDDQYGYGYNDDGVLVALFTLAGALLPQSYLYDNADVAGRYYYRGEDLRRTARRDRRMRVQDDYWRERAPVLVAAQTPWIQAASQQPEWRTYRTRTAERDLRRFEPERARRAPRIDRAIGPDRRTLANLESNRQERGGERDQRRFERQDRRDQDRGFQQQVREDRRQTERARDDGQRVANIERERARELQRAQRQQADNGRRQEIARVERDQAREAQRQQRAQRAQRAQVENGRRQEVARVQRDQTREAQRQQREQRQQAENGRRQEVARVQRDQTREAQRQQREQHEQAENGRRQEMARAQQEQARQAQRQQREQRQQAENGRRQETARNAERHAQQAAAQQQQAQARPERGQGGGGREDRGDRNGKGGGRGKD